MDGGMIGLIGGALGGLVGVAGAVYGCRASYRSAGSDAERRFLRRVFVIGGAYLTLCVAIALAASFGLVAHWIYWVGMAALFAPMPFAISYLSRRITQFPKHSDPSINQR